MKILFVLILLLPIYSCKKTVTTIYYIPKDFEGFFAVVYSQKSGMDSKVINGTRSFYIPESGILLTKDSFYNEGDDIFIKKTDYGFDTLRTFLPIKKIDKDTKFSVNFNKKFTIDINEDAINFRLFNNYGYNKFSKDGNKYGECNFFYEMVTVGKANSLSDTAGRGFKKRLEKFLQDTLCR